LRRTGQAKLGRIEHRIHRNKIWQDSVLSTPEREDKQMGTSQTSECRVIRATDSYEGKQGLNYFCGIAAETVGSKGICMHLLTIPPGARAKAHLHENHETALYVLSGEAVTLYGERLENTIRSQAGDLVYIPAGVPHLPINVSDKPTSAVIARTDPNEQESVVLLPELDVLAEKIIATLK
jgi:uncharacterized RmlC-like cupin family protein